MSLSQVLYVILALGMSALLVVGVVLMIRAKAEHGRAATLGLFGCVVLLLGEVYSIVRIFTISSLVGALGADAFGPVVFVIDLIGMLFNAVGLGLLIFAVIARRTPVQQPQAQGWQQPQQPYGGWQQQQPQAPAEWQPQSPPQPSPSPQPGWQDPNQPGWQNPQG
ncbi:hypothetical protein [Nonomuraea guangzhouensis]|uniref:Uncharacterized protein n=1 Tax=Nonomuraea guangzhouensis TaxID=1291555 RepID=A0ABW4GVV0_9ACTN|nr:hypothetical protein [Nonomuraea guangzhouensis]